MSDLPCRTSADQQHDRLLLAVPGDANLRRLLVVVVTRDHEGEYTY